MVAAAEKKFGKLNVLFNNAGIMHAKDDDAMSTSEEVWDLTLDINAKGVFLGCKYGIPALKRAGGGSIINTASFVANMGAATPQIAYTASKGAVLSMTRELAVIHARQNIRVNALCPGPLKTELLMSFLNTEAKKQRRLVHIPMGRFGEAEEIAKAALFLASDESSYVTGHGLPRRRRDHRRLRILGIRQLRKALGFICKAARTASCRRGRIRGCKPSPGCGRSGDPDRIPAFKRDRLVRALPTSKVFWSLFASAWFCEARRRWWR